MGGEGGKDILAVADLHNGILKTSPPFYYVHAVFKTNLAK